MSYRRRTRIYHYADRVSGVGISALCYARPRRIDLATGRYGWTFDPSAVTCGKCHARMTELAQRGTASLERLKGAL